MAVAPIINYGVGTSGIDTIGADKSSANAPVAIYTIDGKLVLANGTLNDINSLGKGLYILNGVKVLVK